MTRARAVDVGIVVVGAALTATHAWSETIPGPRWLVAALPLLVNLPMLWRRSHPLLAWALVIGGIDLQAVVSGNAAEGIEYIYAFGVGSYSMAAYADRRRALAGLAIGLAGYGLYAINDLDIESGAGDALWAGGFFALYLVACWLAGVFVRGRREQAALAARADALERDGRTAVADERARMARELHDIVSHNLSVVVLQAAGARARANGHGANDTTLEKIERSGRDALVEMRRLLGVLREEDAAAELAPQAGIAQLDELVAGVREAGLDVELAVEGDCSGLSPAVELSAYRIVQEALTNALKHAGGTGARARVRVRREPAALTIEVTDDGAAPAAHGPTGAGRGLIGMRERVALFGGELRVGPRAEGGFGVHARLPLDGEPA
jgi:signal transduction histidine kinase